MNLTLSPEKIVQYCDEGKRFFNTKIGVTEFVESLFVYKNV